MSLLWYGMSLLLYAGYMGLHEAKKIHPSYEQDHKVRESRPRSYCTHLLKGLRSTRLIDSKSLQHGVSQISPAESCWLSFETATPHRWQDQDTNTLLPEAN